MNLEIGRQEIISLPDDEFDMEIIDEQTARIAKYFSNKENL